MPSHTQRLRLCALEDRTAPTAGLMDTTFGGGDGIVTFGNIPNFFNAFPGGVAVQPDGKIVVAATISSPIGGHGLVLRYNLDGSLDNSFSGDGYFTSQFGATEVFFRDVALQSDGKIVATGTIRNGGNYTVMTARLNSDGTVDNTFDSDGYVTTDFSGNNENGYGLAIQSDGKIVVVGENNGGFFFIRYNTNGSRDSGFDLDGLRLHTPGGHGAWGREVAIQPDGKIVGVGGGVEVGSPNKRLMLIRLNPDGSFDTSFDSDGIVTTAFTGTGFSEGYGVAIMPDGRLMASGYGEVRSSGRPVVARYLSNGALDTSFDQDGQILFLFSGVGGGGLTSLIAQPDGKVVGSGNTIFPHDALLMRFDEDGMDESFGVGNFRHAEGVVYTHIAGDENYSVALAPDGLIVTTGKADGNTAVVRYTGGVMPEPDSYSVDEDIQLTVDAPGVLKNDPVPNASPRTVALVDGPDHAASFTLREDGSFEYLPAANYNGPDSFTYKFTADDVVSTAAMVSITVNPINDPPTAQNDAYDLPRIIPQSLTVSAAQGVLKNDVDIDGDTLHGILVDPPAVGTLDLNDDGSFTYDFPNSLNGAVTFTYKVNDSKVDGPTVTVTLTRPANQAPTATDDGYEYPNDSPLNVSAANGVLKNDQDGDGDTLYAELLTQPATGSVNMQPDGSFSYQYPDGFAGPVTFTYRVSDGRDTGNTGTVTLTRVPNQPPVAVDDAYELRFGLPFTADASQGVLANDSDPENDPITATLIDPPAVGDLEFSSDGSFTYTAPINFVGSVTFTYQVEDENATGNVATVKLTCTDQIVVSADSLYIIGSDGAEFVRLVPSGRGIRVEIRSASGILRRLVKPEAPFIRFALVSVLTGEGDDRIDTTMWALGVSIVAGAGNDVIRTGRGSDVIYSDEYLNTGAGNDWVFAGEGDNQIAIGGGNNFVQTGRGGDIINGLDGNNTVLVSDGNNIVYLEDGSHSIQTGKGQDEIYVGDGGSSIDSGAGNDFISAGTGYNRIFAGSGDDEVYAGDGGNFIEAGSGNDFVMTGSGDDLIRGGAGMDILLAGDGADAVEGGSGNDLIGGGFGADVLEGGRGNDILFDGEVDIFGSIDSLKKVLASYNPRRVASLRSITSKIIVLADTTSSDVLIGSAGIDWFWSADGLDTLDRFPTEPMNGVS